MMSRLGQIDWNLVPALWALLTERNVSRAARRLGISQPAASGALARLRRHFGDDLLIRQGQGYELTPLGQRLLPLATEAMVATRTVTDSRNEYDPSTSAREFVVAAGDYGQHVVGPALHARARLEGVHVRVSFRWPYHVRPSLPDAILADVDGWIAPRELMEGHPFSGLLPDRWLCVVADDHPVVGDELTLDHVATLPWVMPVLQRKGTLPQLRQLRALGVEPRVDVTTDLFSTVPFLVAGTERIGIIQERLGRTLAPSTAVRLVECPWPMAPVSFTLWWRQELHSDPAHTWFRDFFARALDDLALAPVGGRDTAVRA